METAIAAVVCAILCIIVIVIAAVISYVVLPRSESETEKKTIGEMSVFENTLATALPQTTVHSIITKHFETPPDPGKTCKKAIVLGFDGARCDSLVNIINNPDSAVMYLKNKGGLYISYAGGDPKGPKQYTDTAPGWASILTGQWAKVHGAVSNGVIKSTACPSLLIDLPAKYDGFKVSFNMLWPGHFDRSEKGTYCDEIDLAKEKGYNLSINNAKTDKELHSIILNRVTEPDCDDFLMCIYERPDENGHGTGFGNKNPKYVEGVKGCDHDAMEVIKAIENRKTFSDEDWLIIITSDHGGRERRHGGQSVMERTTFISSNKKIL